MKHFNYFYDQDMQCLVKISPEGEEIQRIFIPRTDLIKICQIAWKESYEKIREIDDRTE